MRSILRAPRTIAPYIAGLSILALAVGCSANGQTTPTASADKEPARASASTTKKERVVKTEAEWRKILSPTQYRILREKGTERAFTGEYYKTKTKGTYVCAGCGQALFHSDHKYESGSGWPSFFKPIEDDHVDTESDRTFGMVRTEILCSKCGGHLGHVFEDGPRPTGLRYCVNSASLALKPADEAKTDDK